jgi:hypothetical protein
MKYFLLILIIFTAKNIQSQDYKEIQNNWVKIIILDGYGNGYSGFSNKYEITKKDLLVVKKLKNQQDSIIKKIELETINKLFSEFNNDNLIIKDPLSRYRKDSTWLINNAEKLWNNYDMYTTDEIDIAAIEVLKNYSEIKEVIESMQGERWTNDYPYIEVKIIGEKDTLKITSEGQYPFMLPWIYQKDTMFYNSKISEIIASFLPNTIVSNRKRLSGENFNQILINEIYSYKIEDKVEFIQARRSHPIKFKKIEKYYQITKAQIVHMSSLSWREGSIAARCLDLKLQDTIISKNIYFSVILGKRLFLYPVNPLLRLKKKVVKKLENNPIYQYTLENKNSIGDITFVNRNSLSKKAKRSFLEDVKEQNLNLDNLKYKLNNAILYYLREVRNNKRSYSTWLFLDDGTIILWKFDGDFLMDFPKEIVSKKGDLCKIIDRNLIRKGNFK